MRKVLFALFIPIEFEDCPATPRYPGGRRQKESTGCYGEISEPGVFHQWCVTCRGTNDSFSSNAMAIIETRSGNIKMIPAEFVQFMEPTKGMWDGRPVLIFSNHEQVRIAGSDETVFFTDDMDTDVIASVVCMFNDGRSLDDIEDYLANVVFVVEEHWKIIMNAFYSMPK